MTHLSRDKTATKMGHPIVVAWFDVGLPAKGKATAKADPCGMTTRKAEAKAKAKATANAEGAEEQQTQRAQSYGER